MGECDCLGCSPTVPVEDDGGSLLLGGGENAIVVGIEEAHDLFERLSPMVIAKYFCMDEWVTVAKVCRKLHFGMLCVIPTNKASDKPDNDHVPDGGGSHRRTHFRRRHFLAMRDARDKNHRSQDKNMNSELPMSMARHANFSRFAISVSLGDDEVQLHLRCIPGNKDSHLIAANTLFS
jgi:hypothetical protein